MEIRKRNSHRGGDYREYHGLRYTDIYHVWLQINQRCYNHKNKAYVNYGGRGIFVCDNWRKSFICFYNDMSLGYIKGLQLDRINNNGPYCLENCRWTTSTTNTSNRRNFGKYMRGIPGKTKGGKFIARINIEKVKYTIGYYDTELEAHNEFMKVHREWHGF